MAACLTHLFNAQLHQLNRLLLRDVFVPQRSKRESTKFCPAFILGPSGLGMAYSCEQVLLGK